MKWQPIETAPRDRGVLVWDKVSGCNVSFFARGVNCWSDELQDGWFTPERDNRDECMILEGPVTHWMPLPEPPK